MTTPHLAFCVVTLGAFACAGPRGTSSATSEAAPRPLIPRRVLFEDAARAKARLSPDGEHIAFVAPSQGVMNVFVAPLDAVQNAKAITSDKGRGIHSFAWAHSGTQILYVQDRLGDESDQLFAVDLRNKKERALTPANSTQARLLGLSNKRPDTVLVGLNDRDPRVHDLYQVNIKTGARVAVLKNPGYVAFLADKNLQPVIGFAPTKEGGFELMKHHDAKWTRLIKFSMENSTGGLFELGPNARWIYFGDPRGHNTAALSRINIATGQTEVIVQDTKADIVEVLMDPTTGEPQAAASNYMRKRWYHLGDELKADFKALATLSPGDFEIVSRSTGDTRWLVAFDADSHPLRYYLYDRTKKQGRLLFSTRPELEKYPLAKMRPVIIKARDGLDLVAYVTLPTNVENPVPATPLPTVIYPHGGPWDRDVWGFNTKDQWLADRGYAVLRVNFRGSTGLGKDFINAANKEWAAAMHNDVLDTVSWAVSEGISDPERTMIMGGSYGGYETLVGLTFSPDTFACGIARVAWSDLIDYLNKTASYNQAFMDLVAARVGDPRTEDGRAFLQTRSPISRASQLSKPLLLAQGAQDPRSKPEEADKFIAAAGPDAPITYLLYKNEGHAFRHASSRISFNATSEIFLRDCLGGRAEPLGNDLQDADFTIVHGAQRLPWLTRTATMGSE